MKVLLFGATGSAGGGVLAACIDASDVDEVRAITRRRLATTHPKVRAVIHDDFLDYSAVEDVFSGLDACFFCLGISVRQVSGEAEYTTITKDFAVAAARALRAQSPNAAFHYVSGQGTSERSWFMWARVKADAERTLIGLVHAVCWRPASIDGADSDSSPRLYQAFRPVARVLLRPFRSLYVTGEDLGRAMLQATREGVRSRIIENAAIRDLADRATA